jgi:hypothetical protein
VHTESSGICAAVAPAFAIVVLALSVLGVATGASPDGAQEATATSGSAAAPGPAVTPAPDEAQRQAAEGLAAIPVPPGAAQGEAVVAYYCHQTIRCETCLMAERLIHDLLETDFAAELEKKGLIWQTLDYEQPENAAYAQAFRLEGGPAFVLARWRAGRLAEWYEDLDIWDHSDDPVAFVAIARNRLKLFLQADKWRAAMDSTGAAKPSPSGPPDAGSETSTEMPNGR